LEVSKGSMFVAYNELDFYADAFNNAGISEGSVEQSEIRSAMIGRWPLLNYNLANAFPRLPVFGVSSFSILFSVPVTKP